MATEGTLNPVNIENIQGDIINLHHFNSQRQRIETYVLFTPEDKFIRFCKDL